jgi:hypothetical protein
VEREAGALEALASQPGVQGVERDERGLCSRVDAASRRLAALVGAAEPFGITEVEFQRPSLEDVYLHYTGHTYVVDADSGSDGDVS